MAQKRKEFSKLEKELQNPDIWKDREKAVKFSQRASQIQEELGQLDELKKELSDIKDIISSANESERESFLEDFEKKLKNAELRIFLSGRYDKGNAILSIYSGAGGQDAQDWAAMLFRMYERYCGKSGFQVKILHQSFSGEGGGPEGRIGIKLATFEIKGKYAFGFLKKENGVHRLVRISPFSAQSLRHTSFALVEVLPELSEDEESEIKIKPEELRVDTFRSSGPGGQNVNRRESAVRITHLPTGIAVACQVERTQGQNKAKAMKILLAKLYQLKEEKTKKELKEIKGELMSASPHTKIGVGASWGNQIRSYVLHPYKLIKDLRSNFETSDVEVVLDGDLDEFIAAEVKL